MEKKIQVWGIYYSKEKNEESYQICREPLSFSNYSEIDAFMNHQTKLLLSNTVT